MADPTLALDLLLATDPIEAGRLAAELERINQERRDIEAELADEAMKLVERTYDGGRVIVVGGEGWHEGVKGIVASRLTNRYHVPTLLFSISDGIARGSGRSVGSVNLFNAVEQCSDLLIRFGGHAGAVGVTLEADRLDDLRARLSEVLGELPRKTSSIRAKWPRWFPSPSSISIRSNRSRCSSPLGRGNKVPQLAATGVTMCDRAVVGKSGEHMRFVATDGASSVPAIMFRVPDIEQRACCDSVVDLVFEAVAEHWQGRVKPKLMVKDILCHACDDADATTPEEEEGEEGVSCDVAEDNLPQTVSSDRRAMLARLPYGELTRSLVHAFIGARAPACRANRGPRCTGAGRGRARGDGHRARQIAHFPRPCGA